MATREERKAGRLATGEVDGVRFAEHVGVAHGTVKRWLHEGMPARREGHRVWVTIYDAEVWLESRARGRNTIAFSRKSLVYLAQRADGLIKIGWSSDVERRVRELRRDSRSAVELLACFPGDKPDELALHALFADLRVEDEWFHPGAALLAFLESMKAPLRPQTWQEAV